MTKQNTTTAAVAFTLDNWANMSDAEKLALVQAFKAKAEAPSPLRLKVSRKGAVSLYGTSSRFPTTLYSQTWLRVLDYGPTIRQFITEHASELSTGKNDPRFAHIGDDD